MDAAAAASAAGGARAATCCGSSSIATTTATASQSTRDPNQRPCRALRTSANAGAIGMLGAPAGRVQSLKGSVTSRNGKR